MFFNKHYPCLDFLRSIAIILVMLVHLDNKFFHLPKETLIYHFVSWGWNGVGLFFALSGFLIGGQIIEALQRDSFSFKIFYIKRFWRIFPPYYFSLLVVALLFFTGLLPGIITPIGETTEIIKSYIYHIFYLQNYTRVPRLQGSLYWSLAVEEQFYILAPLLFYALWKYLKPAFCIIITALILIPISTRFILYGHDINWLYSIRFSFQTRFDSFLFGVLAAYFFIFYNKKLRDSSLIKGFFFLSAFAALGTSLIYGKAVNGYFNTCWQLTFTAFGFAMLTLSMALSSFDFHIHRYLKKFFALVAKLSYTMYLYHLILIFPMGNIIIKIHRYLGYKPSPVSFALSFCLYFLAVLLISAIIYRFIDRSAMNYRKKILKRMSALKN